jgi:hypothetical protein
MEVVLPARLLLLLVVDSGPPPPEDVVESLAHKVHAVVELTHIEDTMVISGHVAPTPEAETVVGLLGRSPVLALGGPVGLVGGVVVGIGVLVGWLPVVILLLRGLLPPGCVPLVVPDGPGRYRLLVVLGLREAVAIAIAILA